MNENPHKNAQLMEQDAIDIKALFSVWLKKLPLILLATVVFALVGYFGTKMRMTPMYSSDTKVYILVKEEYQGASFIDFSTSSLIADDMAGIIVSRPIMEEVIEILGLQTSPEALGSQISLEAEEYARIITIRVVDSDPERARQIANTVREVGCVKIADIMKSATISTIEEANYPTPYYTMNPRRNAVYVGAGGFFLVLLILALVFWLDDSIKTQEDIEKYLGLTVLAVIPQRSKSSMKQQRSRAKKEKKRKKRKNAEEPDPDLLILPESGELKKEDRA